MVNKESIKSVLSIIYDDSTNEERIDDILIELERLKINSLINYYIHVADVYDEDDKDIIMLIIRILQNIYNNTSTNPPVPDEIYDQLYEVMLDATSVNIVGGDIMNDKKTVSHMYPDLRGTLDKVHFITEYDRGKDRRKSIEFAIASMSRKIGEDILDYDSDVYIFPKFDGVSIEFECDENGKVIHALTRGNTTTNEATDVGPLFINKVFDLIPNWKGPFGVKTEVVMNNKDFKRFCKKYGAFKNPRIAVSGIVNSKEINREYLRYLTVVPLRAQNYETKEVIVHPDALTKYPLLHSTLSKYRDWGAMFDTIKECMSEMVHIPIDGAVIYIKDKSLQKRLGRENNINKYEIAYKYPAETCKTIIRDVNFCIGVLGNITPVAVIDPVIMNGNTIDSPSLGSIDRFKDLGLCVGDEVIIKYDIIPYLSIDDTCKRSGGYRFTVPRVCPECGESLVYNPVLRCDNMACPSRIIGKIVNYLEKMDIPNLSIGRVTSLYKVGILKRIQDLYLLPMHRNDIIKLDGFGVKTFTSIINGIDSKTKVYDYVLLGSLGISNVGRRIFKKILNIYYIDELLDICQSDDISKLLKIPGIKEKMAEKIKTGILSNVGLIEFLTRQLDIIHDDGQNGELCVLFTKVRDNDFEEFLRNKNIDIATSYTKNVDIVITPTKDTVSTKTQKARKDGKEVLTLLEAHARFGFNG